jgi:hypothetical protein
MCLNKGKVLLLKIGRKKRKCFNDKACEEINTAYSNTLSEKMVGY